MLQPEILSALTKSEVRRSGRLIFGGSYPGVNYEDVPLAIQLVSVFDSVTGPFRKNLIATPFNYGIIAAKQVRFA